MKPRTRVIIIVAVVVALVAACSSAAFGAVSWVKKVESAAYAGKASAEAGAHSIASQDATAALAQFRSAKASFATVRTMTTSGVLSSVGDVFPWSHRQFVAVRTLAAIGIDGSEAGTQIATAFRDASSTPVPAGSSRLATLLKTGRARIDAALSALSDAAALIPTLQEQGLDPRLASAVRSVKSALSGVAPFLDRSRGLLALERYVLSGQHRILILSQDSAELRPTGGFIGSFGVLDIGPDGLALSEYADVYTLRNPPGIVPVPVGAIPSGDFQFRDANWWLDFPTSARRLLGFWKDTGQKPVDAVVAIDIVTVKDLLAVLGPVRVKSYGQTFTSDNLLDRLLYIIEVQDVASPNKKGVLVALANQLEARLVDSGLKDLSASALALAASADAKHVQMYFTDPVAQAAVTALGWAGTIVPPSGATDVLAVSNAMNRGGKINIAMRKSTDYSVALKTDGSAATTLVLDYANTASAGLPPALNGDFHDYLRVYRAPGTVLAPGSASATTAVAESGLAVVATGFVVPRAQRRTETIVALVPHAMLGGPSVTAPRTQAGAASVAPPAGGVSRYGLFLVRQADLQDIPTTVTVTAPMGWRIVTARAWKTAAGTSVAVTSDGTTAHLSLALDADLFLSVELQRR
jgi:hypothetical protein